VWVVMLHRLRHVDDVQMRQMIPWVSGFEARLTISCTR
jgi:hypothetical protein